MVPAPHQLLAVLYAKDMNRLAAFYEALLSLRRVEQGSSFILLGSEALELCIVQAPPHIANAIELGAPPAIREHTPLKLSFRVPDAQALRSLADGLGGGLREAATSWSWRGCRHLDGWDPEGNVFQLRQHED